jgi:elongation factor P
MPAVGSNEVRVRDVILHDGGIWRAVKIAHVKPGKGGAFNQIELKNLVTGSKLNERFRSEDKVERVSLDLKSFSFLYEQGDVLVFMDQANYEQIELARDWVGEDQVRFLHDGMLVKVEMHEERALGIELPPNVVLEVVEAEPTVRGQTASSSYKPAKASNGMRIMIPPFMDVGERILVSTETGEYLRRADQA